MANVKAEFRKRAISELGKKLIEETLIAWQLHKRLVARNWSIEWEHGCFQTIREKKCDLVVSLDNGERLWLEIKLAWKAWANCKSPPTYANPFYPSYLRGSKIRSHSLRDDFQKLNTLCPATDHRAVCLVGFDSLADPMDGEVSDIFQEAQLDDPGWQRAMNTHWPDRRNTTFRINVLVWWRHGDTER